MNTSTHCQACDGQRIIGGIPCAACAGIGQVISLDEGPPPVEPGSGPGDGTPTA